MSESRQPEWARTEARPFRGLNLTYVVTSDLSVRTLLRGQLAAMRSAGFDVTVMSGGSEDALGRASSAEGAHAVHLPLVREVRPWRDLRALFALLGALIGARPDVVLYGTPKAGLLGALASWALGVRVRVYTLRGLRYETARGFGRRALIAAEKLVCAMSHSVVCVSPSLLARAQDDGVIGRTHAVVLGAGSSNGVDTEWFRPPVHGERAAARETLGLPAEATVIAFVGRLTHDKGIEDLLEAFAEAILGRNDLWLLVVGDMEPGDPVSRQAADRLGAQPHVVHVPFMADVRDVYAAADILALPSYREGFPNAPLEAAASGVPSVVYGCTGCVDAVVDGATGRIVPVGDRAGLSAAFRALADDSELRRRMGDAARERACREFDRARVHKLLEGELADCLDRRARARERLGKRTFDIVAGGVALLIAAIPMAIISAVLLVAQGWPVVFRQRRPGRDGRAFDLVKFRTMRAQGSNAETDEERLTGVGRFLRATSLDELPELFNILAGDMSVVGPRPLLMEYLERYSAYEARRHLVRPGLTGWAQVNGRNVPSWNRKLEMDVYYVDHRSFWFDMRIIWRTVGVVLSRKGVSAEGSATTKPLTSHDERSQEPRS